MPVLQKHTLKVRYEGGIADEHALPLYDGTASIHGVAQALQIATHAYLTGEVVSRATAAKGAHFQLKPARNGSFLFEIVTLLEKYPATSSTMAALSAPVFYDFLKVVFNRAVGALDTDPETAHLKKVFNRTEPPLTRRADLDAVAEQLEGPLQRAHRPIGDDGDINRIKIERPRGELVTFNAATKAWVNTREEDPDVEEFIGNVTRFNSLSRNGRMFMDEAGRVVPFRPHEQFTIADLPLLTWSLHGSNTGLPNKLRFTAKRIVSAVGETKRLLLLNCESLQED